MTKPIADRRTVTRVELLRNIDAKRRRLIVQRTRGQLRLRRLRALLDRIDRQMAYLSRVGSWTRDDRWGNGAVIAVENGTDPIGTRDE